MKIGWALNRGRLLEYRGFSRENMVFSLVKAIQSFVSSDKKFDYLHDRPIL